MWKQK
jgi:hypothetical protein